MLPLQLTRRLFVEEEVYFKAGLWLVWEDPPRSAPAVFCWRGCPTGLFAALRTSEALQNWTCSFAVPPCDLCERVPIGTMVILW